LPSSPCCWRQQPGWGWWLLDRLDRLGWGLPRDGQDLRELVLTEVLTWTLLRCNRVLLSQNELPAGWLSRRTPAIGPFSRTGSTS
jgi:hypothetical protein